MVKPAFAQVDIGQIFAPAQKFPSVGALVSVFFPNVLVIIGVILLVLILGAGFTLITSAGAGDPQKTGQAKKTLTYALVGVFLIFSSFFIIQIVTFITGIQITNPGF